MVAAGRSYGSPSISSMIQWCETPRPSARLPSHTACTDSACANRLPMMIPCLRQCDRMAGLNRDDRGADLDARRDLADDRSHRQRVELVGDLGDPDRGEANVVGPLGRGAETLDLRRVAGPLRTHRHPDPHPAPVT